MPADGTKNLIPLKSGTERTKRILAMAHAANAKSKKSARANAFKNLKYCSEKCPLFPCIYAAASLSRKDKKCIVKQLPKEKLWNFYHINYNGQQGIRVLMKKLLTDLTHIAVEKGGERRKRALLKQATEIYKTLYKDETAALIQINNNPAEKFEKVYAKVYGGKEEEKEIVELKDESEDDFNKDMEKILLTNEEEIIKEKKKKDKKV